MDSWTHRLHSAASRRTIASVTLRLHLVSDSMQATNSFPVPLRVGSWVGLTTQQVSNLLKVAWSKQGESRTQNLSVTSPILYQQTNWENALSRKHFWETSRLSAEMSICIFFYEPECKFLCESVFLCMYCSVSVCMRTPICNITMCVKTVIMVCLNSSLCD